MDNVYLKGFNLLTSKNYDFYAYLNSRDAKISKFNLSHLKKNFILSVINLKKIKLHKIISYTKQKNQSNFFIDAFNSLWTSQIFSKIKNHLILKNFNKSLNNLLNYRVNNYRLHSFINFSLLNLKRKFNLDIKRILTYGKLFLKIPSKLLKYKLRLTKASTLIANKGFFRTFLFTFYQKNIFNKIMKFNYNFFFIISSLIRFNYGFSFSLLKFKRTSYKNLDNLFFII